MFITGTMAIEAQKSIKERIEKEETKSHDMK